MLHVLLFILKKSVAAVEIAGIIRLTVFDSFKRLDGFIATIKIERTI